MNSSLLLDDEVAVCSELKRTKPRTRTNRHFTSFARIILG
jgi:hypothetical protein